MENGFREAGTFKEFIKDLEILKHTEHELIIWQNDANDEKQIYNGSFESWNKEKDRLFINVNFEDSVSFEKDNPIYIFEKDNGILFKGRYEYL